MRSLKNFLGYSFILVFFFFCNVANSQIVLKGNIQLHPEWTPTIYIASLDYFTKNHQIIDSIALQTDGSFEHTLLMEQSSIFLRLFTKPKQSNVTFVTDSRQQNLIYLLLEDKKNYKIQSSVDAFFAQFKIDDINLSSFIQKLQTLTLPFWKMRDGMEEVDRTNADSLFAFQKRIQESLFAFRTQFEIDIKQYILQQEHPATIIGGLYEYYKLMREQSDVSFIVQHLNRLNKDLYPIAKNLIETFNNQKPQWVGVSLPNAVLIDYYTDQVVDIKSISKKKMILDFWASWCGPCRITNKTYLPEFITKIESLGYEFVGINIDQTKEEFKQSINSDKISWKQFWDEDGKSLADVLGIAAYPTYIVLNDQKIIEFVCNDFFELQKYLNQ